MQKKYLILISLFIQTGLFAQDWELVTSNIRDYEWVDVIKYNEADDSWIVAQSDAYFDYVSITLSKMNAQGTVLWENDLLDFSSAGKMKVLDIEINPNGDIYLVFKHINYGALFPFIEEFTILRLDENGLNLGVKRLPYGTVFNDLHLFGDNHIAVATSDSLFVMDKDFANHWTTNLDISTNYKKRLRRTSDNKMIVFDETQIWKFNPEYGFFLGSTPSTAFLNVTQNDEWFYMLDSFGVVIKMDSDLSVSMDSAYIANPMLEVKDWIMTPNGHSIMLGRNENISILEAYDSNFVLKASRDFSEERGIVRSIDVSDDRVLIAGGIPYSELAFTDIFNFNDMLLHAGGFMHSFFKTLDFDLDSDLPTEDVTILSLDFDDYEIYGEYCMGAEQTGYRVEAPTIKVMNNGNTTIHHLRLILPDNSFCNEYDVYGTVAWHSLNLAPGDSIQRLIPRLIGYRYISVYIHTVNGKIDEHMEDNSFHINMEEIAMEEPPEPTVFSVYPNPAQDFINVEVNESATSFEYKIFNSVGQLIQSENNIDTEIEKVIPIDIRKLQTGYYIIKVKRNFGEELVMPFIKH